MRRLLSSIIAVLFGGWIISRIWRGRFSFAGRVTVITGGSRGLGLVLARQLCDEGAKVILLARDEGELARARSELTSLGGKVTTIPCDLREPAQIKAAVAEALQKFGRIDIVINNAGIIEVGPL